MIPTKRQAQVSFFFGSALAALQNITVDDAVLTGPVVPQYLPSPSSWNQGNDCPGCLAKPDSAYAYNGTWHDATFEPYSATTQEIEFTFTGSALYIFFILANSIPNCATLTALNFYLDDSVEPVGTYVHLPSTSNDYQYNVPVYVNDALPFNEHTMVIQPVESGESVLMLFDYLIYTVNAVNTTTSSSASPSSTGTSAGNTAAIVGGTVGGVAALVLMTASLFCYRRYGKRKRHSHVLPMQEGPVLDAEMSPAHLPLQMHYVAPPRPTYDGSIVSFRPQSLAISIDPPSTAALDDNSALLEQVALLRDEVSRLRRVHQGAVSLKS